MAHKMSQKKCHSSCIIGSMSVYSLILVFASYAAGSVPISPKYYADDLPTEPPDLVETFNTQEWISKGANVQKIQITNLKVETKVKLRYGRTLISINLNNRCDKPLQSSFRIILPQDGFFTIFKLKRGNGAKFYTASVVKKQKAREMFHFAHIKTNGTVTAGFIELSNDKDINLSSYNLKFTLGPGVSIQAFLLYERQIERKDDLYSDTVYIYPMEDTVVRMLETSVEVEEIENVKKLHCSNSTEKTYTHCSRSVRRRKNVKNKAELVWRGLNVSSDFLKANPFEFQYELQQQNTTSAVVIAQSNGNLYFVHLFVPQNLPLIRKHIVFLLDVSDSMHGKKLDQLKWSMTEILDDLSPEDFFSIIPFSDDVTVWSPFRGEMRKCPFPFPATFEHKDAVHAFVNSIVAHGVTNIESGMLTAFDIIQLFSPHSADVCDQYKNIHTSPRIKAKLEQKLPENVESMIFFLSDGIATTGIRDSNILLELFTHLNHQNLTRPIQIHTIAYGEAADAVFLKALSSQNGGIMKIILDESAAGIELTNFYTEISSPVLSQIQTFASINGTHNQTFTKEERVSSYAVLVKGTEVVTAGRLLPGMNQSELIRQPRSSFQWSTEASSKMGNVRYQSQVHDCRSLTKSFGKCVERIDFYVLRLQAYQLLKKLLDRDSFVRKGYICPKSYENDVIYSDNLMSYNGYFDYKDDNECVNPYKEKITELALKEGFITPYTAFILSTEPQVDIGLLGNIDRDRTSSSNVADPASESESEETGASSAENEDDSDSVPQKISSDLPEGETHEPLPHVSKLVGMKGSELEVTNGTTYNITFVGSSSRNQTWLTKFIRDFVKTFLEILQQPVKHGNRELANVFDLPIPLNPPFP